MALVHVQCPQCQSIDMVQYGKQANGTQRYRCNHRDGPHTIFLWHHPQGQNSAIPFAGARCDVSDRVQVLRISRWATIIRRGRCGAAKCGTENAV